MTKKANNWIELKAPESGEPRLDVFLAGAVGGLSRTAAQRLIEEENVTVNGAPAKARTKLLPGDKIAVLLPAPKPSGLAAQEIPLHIYHQDEHLAVIEKPAGLVVHPAAGHEDGTLVNALLHHLKDLSRGSGIGGELRPGIVHRIDRNTSGVLLVTKNDEAHRRLTEQFKEHSITRKYLGVCWGQLPSAGEWKGNIGRDPKERKRMALLAEGGRSAVTRFRTLEHFGSAATFFEAELLTGRTHQVRVHFAHHGYPLLGDSVYAAASPIARAKREAGMKAIRRQNAQLAVALAELDEKKRQFLHAAVLGFTHPATGQWQEFLSEIPEELALLMVDLRKCKL